jgi:hypothetical protein
VELALQSKEPDIIPITLDDVRMSAPAAYGSAS